MKKISLTFLVASTIAGASLAASPAARAQDGAAVGTANASGGSFGQAGQWVYSIAGENEFPLSISRTGDGAWNLTLRPGIDYFLARSVSVGGIVSLHKQGGFSDIGVGARVGYNIPITSLVSFWARGGVFVHNYDTDNGPNGTQTIVSVNAPFLFHVLPRAFAGVGPFFSMPVQNSDDNAGSDATYGLTAILGGWF